MNVKIDTKEKFHELHLLDSHITAIMTGDLQDLLSDLQKQPPHNLVLSLEQVKDLSIECAKTLADWQGKFYEASYSFVLCHLSKEVEASLDEAELLELLNATPTISEAWDIVQMEEIERELLDGFDEG